MAASSHIIPPHPTTETFNTVDATAGSRAPAIHNFDWLKDIKCSQWWPRSEVSKAAAVHICGPLQYESSCVDALQSCAVSLHCYISSFALGNMTSLALKCCVTKTMAEKGHRILNSILYDKHKILHLDRLQCSEVCVLHASILSSNDRLPES
jgi:hypothetical protein